MTCSTEYTSHSYQWKYRLKCHHRPCALLLVRLTLFQPSRCTERYLSLSLKWGKKKENWEPKRKWVNQSGRVHGDMCVFLSVCHCMCLSVSVFVCACLRRTTCPETGGLSGWICQKPGGTLCTIRIKVAISGCYLLRDVLCSHFWWPLRPSPLSKAEMACSEYLGWDL